MGIKRDLSKGISLDGSVGDSGISILVDAEVSISLVDPIYISAWMYDSIVQGTWALTLDANSPRRGYILNSSNSDGDELAFRDYMMGAGTYTLKLLGVKSVDHGIIKVKIDDVVVATFDMYNVGAVYNEVQTQSAIVIDSGGVKTIKVGIDGTSLTNYYMYVSELVFYRTA